MSTTTNMNRKGLRWQLLASVSAAALLASAYGSGKAQAADSDRPLLWIELGGQLDRLSDTQDAFNPAFLGSITQPGQLSALDVQQQPSFAIDAEGKLSFQPEGSDWLFSASIRYGRSKMSRHRHQQTANVPFPILVTYGGKYFVNASVYPASHVKFADGAVQRSERHLILDFVAGKDVGLGMFGSHSSSTLSAGVRVAQFTSKANVALRAVSDLQYPSTPIVGTLFAEHVPKYAFFHDHINFHAHTGLANIERSFDGVGPSLTWNGSAPFAGESDSGELSFDWGVNAAALFGRQKVKGHHKTTVQTYSLTTWVFQSAGGGQMGPGGHPLRPGVFFNYANPHFEQGPVAHHTSDRPVDRSRNVTVPNLGGFAGISFRIQNFKASLGYRADFFFNAIDGGIDTQKSENRGFFGPYASISIGIGD